MAWDRAVAIEHAEGMLAEWRRIAASAEASAAEDARIVGSVHPTTERQWFVATERAEEYAWRLRLLRAGLRSGWWGGRS